MYIGYSFCGILKISKETRECQRWSNSRDRRARTTRSPASQESYLSVRNTEILSALLSESESRSLFISGLFSIFRRVFYALQYQSAVGSSCPYNVCFPWFQRCCPSVWNSLPADIRACSSPHTFRHLLETHCFYQASSSP